MRVWKGATVRLTETIAERPGGDMKVCPEFHTTTCALSPTLWPVYEKKTQLFWRCLWRGSVLVTAVSIATGLKGNITGRARWGIQTHWTTKPSGSIWSTSERYTDVQWYGTNQMRNLNNVLGSFPRESQRAAVASGVRMPACDWKVMTWIPGRIGKNKYGPQKGKAGKSSTPWETAGTVPLSEGHAGVTGGAVLCRQSPLKQLHVKTARMLRRSISAAVSRLNK